MKTNRSFFLLFGLNSAFLFSFVFGLQQQDVGFGALRKHRSYSQFSSSHSHCLYDEPRHLGSYLNSGPFSFLTNTINLFTNGHWFNEKRSFHEGYGSLHINIWNTHKWRKERYRKIQDKLHGHRKNYESWIGVNPETTLLDMFPKLKNYDFNDLKRCYHASYDNEDFNPFHHNLSHAFEHYYKYYPENYHEERHSHRIKNLYRNFQEVTKSILECMQKPRRYRLGFTQLSDMSEHEYSSLLGAEADPKELLKKYRQKLIIKNKTSISTTTPFPVQNMTAKKPKIEEFIAPENRCISKSKNKLPTEFSWRKLNKTTPAKYQGACGSCWSFASLTTIESVYLIKNKTKVNLNLSEQEPLRCINKKKNGCLGGTSMDVFNYILTNNGVRTELSIPYNISNTACQIEKDQPKVGSIDDYCARGNLFEIKGKPEVLTDEDIQRVVYEFGPIYSTIDSKDLTFKNLIDGIYENANCSTKTNHAVTIVGWDAESWHIKNSWGVRWGDAGYFRMKRHANTCGIRNYITFPILN